MIHKKELGHQVSLMGDICGQVSNVAIFFRTQTTIYMTGISDMTTHHNPCSSNGLDLCSTQFH